MRLHHLEDPRISYEKAGKDLILKCEKPALGVNIRVNDENYSGENFFALFPGKEKIIKDIEGEISIKSMFDYL